MVTLLLDSERLEVVLSVSEQMMSFRRGKILVPRAQISRTLLTDDPWIWLRGAPSPGIMVPGIRAMGTWKSGGGSDFAIVRGRRPSVVLDLAGHEEFQRLVLTTRHRVALVKALRLAGESTATVVIDIVAPSPSRNAEQAASELGPAT